MPRVLIGLILAFFGGISWQLVGYGKGPLLCDDAFITLSHAQQLAAGSSLLASPHNPVDAATSPFYAVLLAGLHRFLGVARLENAALALGILGSLASLWALYLLGRQAGLGVQSALALMAAWAVSHSLYATGLSGMETPLYIAGLLFSHVLWMHRDEGERFHRTLLALVFVLALWRPEGFLLALALGGAEFWRASGRGFSTSWRAGRKVWPMVLAGVLGTLAYFAAHYLAWGHVLPQSVLAKQAGIRVHGWAALQNWFEQGLLKGPMLGGQRILTLLWCLAVAVAALGLLRTLFSRRRASSQPVASASLPPLPFLLFLWPALYFALYFFSGASQSSFSWYYTPVMPFLLLAIALGWQRVAGEPKTRDSWICRHLWLLTFLLLGLGTWTFFRLDMAAKAHRAQQFRELRYAKAAAYLNEQKVTGQVLMDEVGVFAYRGHFSILDFHGLLSPEAVPQVSANHRHGPRLIGLVTQFQPEWVAWTVWYQQGSTSRYGEFGFLQTHYHLAKTFADPAAPHELQLWKKR
jgi:hypothetical protein